MTDKRSRFRLPGSRPGWLRSRGGAGTPMREVIEWQPARLRNVRDLTPDIRLFEIEPAQRFDKPTPGCNINVAVQIAGRPDVRSYSVVGPCTDGVYRIALKLLPDTRGGSAYMH